MARTIWSPLTRLMANGGVWLLLPLSVSGCDYWPPALQSHIEALRAELNDVMDDRQRLDVEVVELKASQATLQHDIDEKTRENAALTQRLTAFSQRPARPSPAPQTERAKVGLTRPHATPHNQPLRHTSIRKGLYAALQLEYPHRQGPHVERIQRLLRRHALPIRADGIFGRNTDSAIRSFQRVHGLPADGIVGPRTYRALHADAPRSQQVRQLRLQRPSIAGQDVSRVQRALRRAGYRVPIDGQFGQVTKNAVMRFQRHFGLEPDGIVGPATWSLLKDRR